jgi:hypothetical protein
MAELTVELGKTYRTKNGSVIKIGLELPRLTNDPVFFKSSDSRAFSLNGTPATSLFCGNYIADDPIESEVPEQEYLAEVFIQSLRNHPTEAFEALRTWGEQTFGPVTPSRIVERAQEEMNKELVREVEGDVWTEKALEEAADVIVILTRAPGLWEAIERKMRINFLRKWDVKGDGTGYHIPK